MNRPVRLPLRWLLLAIFIAACLLMARSAALPVSDDGPHYMPPHPALVETLFRTNQVLPNFSAKLSKGIDTPGYVLNPPSGDFNLLVVLVDFEDNTAIVYPQDFDNLFFNTFNYDSVADYYAEISYDALSLNAADLPSELGWQRAPETYDFYVNQDGNTGTSDDFGWGTYPRNLQGIVADTVPLIDAAIDFSNYDNDGDGFVDGVVFVHAGPGAEVSGSPVDIWSAAWDMSSGNGPGPILTGDGVYVDDFVFGPEFLSNAGDMTIGVFAHELGHLLFGLPDLYDLDLSSYSVGAWSLMSYGAWNGSSISIPGLGNVSNGDSPAWPDAWSRIRMGFETPETVNQNTPMYAFTPVENGGGVVKLHNPEMGTYEYFLVEYREQAGYDANLPGSGLLVWHVDETKWNRWDLNLAGCEESPSCDCKSNHPLLALMQADGNLDLETKINQGDAGDPFSDTSVPASFNSNTTPESGSYYASACPTDSCIAVNNITGIGSISADLNVVCQVQEACVNVLTDRQLGWGQAVGGAVYRATVQNCSENFDTLTLSYESDWDVELFDLQGGQPITHTEIGPGLGWTVGISVTPPVTALSGAADELSLTVSSANDASVSTTVGITTTVPYCTLVVDDDNGAPDVEGSYTDALLGAGYDFDLWDTQVRGSPDEATLAAHKAVVWFTGTPITQTLTPHDELALSSYLDGGGGFFFSSQEYLTDTLRDYFGRQYLRVGTFVDNTGTQMVTGVTGNPLSDGLGPYTLSLTTLSDQVAPLSPLLSAFKDEDGNTNAITTEPDSWQTLFLGWPFEHLARTDGEELMASSLSWIGVPQLEIAPITQDVYMHQPVSFSVMDPDLNALSYMWDFGDGTVISRETKPTHKFSESGWYTVRLATSDERCTVAAQMQVYVRPLIYLPLMYHKLDSNVVGQDIWSGNARFALAALSVASLGLMLGYPFRRR